jgi:hypothetical protein
MSSSVKRSGRNPRPSSPGGSMAISKERLIELRYHTKPASIFSFVIIIIFFKYFFWFASLAGYGFLVISA